MTKNLFPASLLASTVLLAAWSAPAFALTEVVHNDQGAIDIGGRLQTMGFAEMLQSESAKSQGRIYLFEKQARLELAATHGDFGFYSQWAFGGEDVYTTNTNLTLLDAYAHGPLYGLADWRVGQFKVPYGRELMSDSGSLAFNDRSIASPFFLMGRDVGAALSAQLGRANVIAGVFTGGGRDVPQRYLPQILGIPLLAARVGVGDLDSDPYLLSQHDRLDTDRTRQSLSVDGLFTRDSLVGHSSVLNVKDTFDKSLLLSSGWNPYIGKKDAAGEVTQGQFWQTGLDYAVKTPVAGGTLSGEAELNYAGFANSFGGLNVFGGRLQAGMYRKPFEYALRYAVVVPDARFAATNTTAGSPTIGQTTAITPDGSPIHEITPAITYFLDGDKLKLTFDLPILVNAPVVTEKGVGSYNLVNQPDQTGVLTSAANSVGRQLVFQVRGGLQYAF